MEHQNISAPAARPATSSRKNQASHQDALAFLTDNHNKARSLFKVISKMNGPDHASDKMDLVKKVCGDLLIHMAVEEGIFYPAVRAHIDDDDLMNEANVEHEGAKDLIVQLGKLDIADPMFDAHLKVLSEYIEHHVKEEETEMFAEVRKTDLDLYALGDQLIDATLRMRLKYGHPAELS